MFRLEKVFQNDDYGFVLFSNFIKSVILLLTAYVFVILSDHSIYELNNYKIFTISNFFFISILLSTIYLILSSFFNNKKKYKINFLSFLKEDVYYILISVILTFAIIFIFNINFKLEIKFIYLLTTQTTVLFLAKLYFNNLYKLLIDKNIIQKNVMLVGTYKNIQKLLKEKFEKIIIFKCCVITDIDNIDIKLLKSEIKFPIFNKSDDLRSILEYHSLGQIWILDGDKNKSEILTKILKYSVDTLNIKLEEDLNIKGKKLLANKYDFEFYEMSRFYGINLFIKILMDKLLSLIFLLVSSPILFFSALAIYIEDGFPIIFTQNRTGWDGRRFKIYKLRTLINIKHNPIEQVSNSDSRKLKVGNFLRKYSIDELPQLLNVLKGEMSLVGPRPHPVSLDLNYASIYDIFLTRYRCNPGLTGWAQVNGFRGATPKPDIMERRMEYDLWYLNNWTIWLDFYIIIKTFYALIKYKGD